MLLGVPQGLLKDVKHTVLFYREIVGVPTKLSTDQDLLANKYRVDTIYKFLRIGDLLRQLGSARLARTL